MPNRTIVAALAVGVSLAAGAAGGALLFAPQLSGAQERAVATADAPGAAAVPTGRGPGAELAVAAGAIGISVPELRTALAGGSSIAQVAKDHGVDVQKVIDAMVADARGRLQRAEASLPDRIAALVNGTAPLGHNPGPGGPRGFGGAGRPGGPDLAAGLDAVAKALGTDPADLRAELRGGKSIADVATEKGVDLQKVIDAAVGAATARIDQAVTDGKLDAAAAARLKASLDARVSALVRRQPRPRRASAGGGSTFSS